MSEGARLLPGLLDRYQGYLILAGVICLLLTERLKNLNYWRVSLLSFHRAKKFRVCFCVFQPVQNEFGSRYIFHGSK